MTHTTITPESSAQAAASSTLAVLDRHKPQRGFDLEAAHRTLARAQLRGWIQYPGHEDTPVSVAARGRELERALLAGDAETVERLGVQGPRQRKRKEALHKELDT